MSLFTRSLNRFAGSSEGIPSNEKNITHRKKISAVSTSLQGDDVPVAASPRNCYTRNNVATLRRRIFDEPDGATMSTPVPTPVELRAAEIRRMNSKNEPSREGRHAQPPIEEPSSSSTTTAVSHQKKARTSTSSLASVFRSRASSPIERMRKLIGRSSSKQPKETVTPSPPTTLVAPTSEMNCHHFIGEIEKLREELAQAQLRLAEQNATLKRFQLVTSSQQTDVIPVTTTATMTDNPVKDEKMEKMVLDKENVRPDIICIEESVFKTQFQSLQQEVAKLKKENIEQKEEFRRTRKDFILILKEAVLRKDEAENKLETISKSISDEDDWITLMSQHRHTLRRNVLLMWVQKKLEPYSDQLSVSNFSSDWTDCRAFCVLLFDLFPETMPDVTISPIVGDCVSRCRRTFQLLEIPFNESALGIPTFSSAITDSGADEDSSSAGSVISGLPDWRYIMNTVFLLYKRGVLGK